jgi:hypothetical protein
MYLMTTSSARATVLVALLLTSCSRSADAKPADQRALVRIMVSPHEAAVTFMHIKPRELAGKETQTADWRISKALGFPEISSFIEGAKAAKHEVTDADFSVERKERALARDDLQRLVDWIIAWKMTAEVSAVLTPMRIEFEDVLAGRDPYGK